MSTWREYDVEITDGSNPRRTVVIRALSKKDAVWVATHPCKRNDNSPPAEEWMGVLAEERA